eukprot:COSAG04_NODE_291_length_17813_cov_32.336231_23_plen_44_part_00
MNSLMNWAWQQAEEDAELEQYDGVTEEYNSLVLQVRSPTMMTV